MTPPEVWVFCSKAAESANEPNAVRRALRKLTEDQGWKYQERWTSSVHGIQLISAADFLNVYRRMHRARVAVISLQGPKEEGLQMLKRPLLRMTGTISRSNDLISLRQLCRNKSFFLRLRWDRDHTKWIGNFRTWMTKVGCESLHDPRCLPMMAFSTDSFWAKQLATKLGRDRFDEEHGGNTRTDIRGLVWVHGALHGRFADTLTVAGFGLPTGFHWDVQANQEIELWTPTEGWRIRKYVNISPDAHIRGKEPSARRLRTA